MAIFDKTEYVDGLKKNTLVWFVETHRILEEVIDYLAFLDQQEKARLKTLTTGKEQKAFIAARVLLKKALSTLFDLSPELFRIEVDHFGAPHLVGAQNPFDIHVSLSRSTEWVACAISAVRVGVDIEDKTRHIDLKMDTSRFFSHAEKNKFDTLPEMQKREYFFRTWCLKEAFVKARGTGFHLPPEDISIITDTEGSIYVQVNKNDGSLLVDAKRFGSALYHPDDRHLLAVAHEDDDNVTRGVEFNLWSETHL